ncbi:MAG: hypothetical protein NWR72_17190 [Bacteroidia bacterium]|nr:hypothetical protein [Bacteroidia bacterium]
MFNSLQAESVCNHQNWEEVQRHAEVLGELLHEMDTLMGTVLRRRRKSQATIEAYQEKLFFSTSSDKIMDFFLSLNTESRLVA